MSKVFGVSADTYIEMSEERVMEQIQKQVYIDRLVTRVAEGSGIPDVFLYQMSWPELLKVMNRHGLEIKNYG